MITFEVLIGDTIADAIDMAIQLNTDYGQLVYFTFNNIPFYIDQDARPNDALKYFDLSLKYNQNNV